jgi:hypothetical protein
VLSNLTVWATIYMLYWEGRIVSCNQGAEYLEGYPVRVQPTDAPAFARLIPSVRMRCSRFV